MKCPEYDHDMSIVEKAKTRSRGGKEYDWTKFTCKHHDTWVEQWVPHTEEGE